ncbi:hypothetical protein ABH999_000775 [Bradyrhizobium yuanmingense]|uniref:extracellular solute-binding protein n=1 Tax=Bradyrhizobium yuanmingense TaxID=108015 RepID=UPI003514616A
MTAEFQGTYYLLLEPPLTAAIKCGVAKPGVCRQHHYGPGAGKARRDWRSRSFQWGGSFTEGVRRYVYEPFTKATGIKVVDVVADLAEPQVKAMHEAGRVDWDIAYVNYPEMHEAQMFVPIDYSLWDSESLEGAPEHTRFKDALAIESSAMVLAYDQRKFPNGGPKNWADFWDVKQFPGLRGLFAFTGKYNIQLALAAAGVAPKDIWPLTDDKLDHAFAKLNEIKPHISKWWSAGGEAPQLLANREYAMSSIYDGRVVAAVHKARQSNPSGGGYPDLRLRGAFEGRTKYHKRTKADRILEPRADCGRVDAGYRLSGPQYEPTQVLAGRFDVAGQRKSAERFKNHPGRLCLARGETPGRQD